MELHRVYYGPFVLIAAQNPCPCGWYGDPVKECNCSSLKVSRYQAGAIPSEGTGAIETAYLAEAIQYRPRRQR